jgi:hypothetical protein
MLPKAQVTSYNIMKAINAPNYETLTKNHDSTGKTLDQEKLPICSPFKIRMQIVFKKAG